MSILFLILLCFNKHMCLIYQQIHFFCLFGCSYTSMFLLSIVPTTYVFSFSCNRFLSFTPLIFIWYASSQFFVFQGSFIIVLLEIPLLIFEITFYKVSGFIYFSTWYKYITFCCNISTVPNGLIRYLSYV